MVAKKVLYKSPINIDALSLTLHAINGSVGPRTINDSNGGRVQGLEGRRVQRWEGTRARGGRVQGEKVQGWEGTWAGG